MSRLVAPRNRTLVALVCLGSVAAAGPIDAGAPRVAAVTGTVRPLVDAWPGADVRPVSLEGSRAFPDGRILAHLALDPAVGEEPYAISRQGEPQLLADTCAGPCDGGTQVNYPLGARMAFVASRSSGERVWWLSDGTPSGTIELAEVQHGDDCGYLVGETAGAVVFARDDGGTGCEPWAFDLTTREWRLLVDGRQGEGGSWPYRVGSVGGRIALVVSAATGRQSLWLVGSSAAEVTELIHQVPSVPSITDFVATGNRQIFRGPGELSTGVALWSTDGTAPGTRRVLDDPRFRTMEPVASLGAVAIVLSTTATSSQLVRSDGTAAGTAVIFEPPSTGALRASWYLGAAVGSAFLFAADDGRHGWEPWWTDGTARGTRIARDVCPGACSSDPFDFRSTGQAVAFFATTPEKGREVWAALPLRKPHLLIDTCPGQCTGLPNVEARGGGWIAVRADDAFTTNKTWLTNGRRGGTRLLAGLESVDFVPSPDASPEILLRGARASGSDTGLLRLANLRATPESVALPLVTSPHSGSPDGLTVHHDGLYFFAQDPAHGREPWHFDGSTAHRVTEIFHGHVGYGPPSRSRPVLFGDGLLFGSYFLSGPQGDAVKLPLPPACSAFESPVPRSDRFFFTCQGSLFVSDGTAAGTSEFDRAQRDRVLPWGGDEIVYFGEQGFTITDGTAHGTRVLPGDFNVADDFVVSQSRLFVPFARDGELGVSDGADSAVSFPFPSELQVRLSFPHPRGYGLLAWNGEFWSNDGTAGGWQRHADWSAEPGLESPTIENLANGIVLQSASYAQRRLARLDESTGEFQDLVFEGYLTELEPATYLRVAGGRAHFLTYDEGVIRLYRTDGASSTAELLMFLESGELGDLTASPDGRRIYLTLTDPTIGRELFVWEP